MIKQSSLLRWNKNGTSNGSNKSGNPSKQSWIHQPDALKYGHIVYLVKFLGTTEVDQPKGIDVVKEGIRKLKFSQHLKRAEGNKTPKVELTVSIDGVAIQEPKGKRILHQYPLHRISYCADDKSEKKFFSFIAKDQGSQTQNCFVFISEKLSEEITLTIGQAFDLAYKRFLETAGRDLEMKQVMMLQKLVGDLERENKELKIRLKEAQEGHGWPKNHNSTNLLDMEDESINQHHQNHHQKPQSSSGAVVGRKLENLLLEQAGHDFNPRSGEWHNGTNGLNGASEKDIFGSEPFVSLNSEDPFGMGKFEAKDLEAAIGDIDKKLAEMRDGFNEGHGLSFGHGDHDFSLDALDPLKQKANNGN